MISKNSKNWVEAAAHEIYDGGYDGTNPVRCTSEEEIQKVIEEHCPFKPDIAYMPVPQCKTCAWWGGFPDVRGRDQCRVRDGMDTQLGEIMTEPDFGCVKWSEKS